MPHVEVLSRPTLHLPPKVEQSGNVRIVTFTADKVRDVADMIARELEGRTDGLGQRDLLLDFTNVECLSSVELWTLITLHKRMKTCGGRLTLFNLSPRVYEVFTATHLQTLLGICREGSANPGGNGSTAITIDEVGASGRTGACDSGDPDKFVDCE
jgi:anti-anti-sigma factor